MPGPQDELTQGEKRETLRQDARQRWGFSSTYHERTAAELQTPGRFSALGQPQVVGQSAGWPAMPSSSPWHGQHVDQDLGENHPNHPNYQSRRPGMKTSGARDPGGAAAPSAPDVEPAPPSSLGPNK